MLAAHGQPQCFGRAGRQVFKAGRHPQAVQERFRHRPAVDFFGFRIGAVRGVDAFYGIRKSIMIHLFSRFHYSVAFTKKPPDDDSGGFS